MVRPAFLDAAETAMALLRNPRPAELAPRGRPAPTHANTRMVRPILLIVAVDLCARMSAAFHPL